MDGARDEMKKFKPLDRPPSDYTRGLITFDSDWHEAALNYEKRIS